MLRNSRKCPAEAEAVRKENIVAADTELALKISVAVKHISEKELRRRNVYVAVFIAASGHVPTLVFNIFLELFKFFGIILLHKLIAVSTLKVEAIMRILFKKGKVIVESFRQARFKHIFKIPVPDRVKMCRCYCVNSFFVCHYTYLTFLRAFFRIP